MAFKGKLAVHNKNNVRMSYLIKFIRTLL